MDTLASIQKRHSYRGEYEDTPVPRKDLKTIMEAGLAAPSGCNTQTVSLVAVDDPELLGRLKGLARRPMGLTSPAFICVLSQRIPSYHGACYATQDYAAAIENMLLAIVSLGYESCWYEGYVTDEEKVGEKMKEVLGVPSSYSLVCVLPVGKAKGETKGPKKKDFEERAWFNELKKNCTCIDN